MNRQYDLNIKVRDDGVYILQTEIYNFHLDEKTHVEKIGRLINENEQLKHDATVLIQSNKDYRKENEDLKAKLESLDEIIDNQIHEVKHTHKNCKKVGIAELKKLKKMLICNSIIDGDVE